jgi:hypothetical protein
VVAMTESEYKVLRYSKTLEVLKKYNEGSCKNKEDIESALKYFLDTLTIQYRNPEPMHVEVRNYVLNEIFNIDVALDVLGHLSADVYYIDHIFLELELRKNGSLCDYLKPKNIFNDD